MTLYSNTSYSPNDSSSFPIERLISFFKESSKIFRISVVKYKTKYQSQDVRYYIFHNLYATSNSCLAFAILMEQNTESTTWWSAQKEFRNYFDNSLVKNLNIGLRDFLKFGHFHSVYMFIEDTLRVVVREIDPNACKQGTDNFKNIYGFLLNKTSLKKYEELFDLCGIFRNSIHNNGYYFPMNKKNSNPINYDGKNYIFRYGKELNVSSYGFMDIFAFAYYLYGELNKMLNDIFDSNEISQIHSIIKPI